MRVCILGGNLTSLTLAKALVNKKIFVDVFDNFKSNSLNQTRTLGISKSNVDFFNKNIININKILWKIKRIEILSDKLNNEKLINFDGNSEYLFSIVSNYKLYNILRISLQKNKYFKNKNLKFKKHFLDEYDLVINTDYSSSITKKYFSKNIVKKYNSFAFTTIINHEKVLNNTATQIFTKNGPLAFLPISENKTSIVYSAHNYRDKKNENIKELIQNFNLKYKIKKIENISLVELKAVNLRSYYHENILAFGDLLHKIHPLTGQGFNMTIRDIRNLILIINNKIALGLPLDYSVNSEFEKKFKDKNFIFSNGVDLIHEFFNLERKTKNNFMSKAVQFVGQNSKLNKMFAKIADEGF